MSVHVTVNRETKTERHMDHSEFIPLAEDHYHRLADFMEKLESVGYEGLAQAGLDLLDRLTGRPVRVLIADLVQALAFAHGINGTGLQYAQLAGYRYRKLDEMGANTTLSFQNIASFLVADDYDPALNVALDVVRALCRAAIEIGPPGVTVHGDPVTKEAMGDAFERELKTVFGDDFNMEELLPDIP